LAFATPAGVLEIDGVADAGLQGSVQRVWVAGAPLLLRVDVTGPFGNLAVTTTSPNWPPERHRPSSDLGRFPYVGVLSRVDEVLGYVAQFDIEVLGSSAQDIEGLVRVYALPLHEDSQSLADYLASP
jgi:hypothetical protein